MKKLLAKDKRIRKEFVACEKKALVFKSIFKNLNFFTLVRWNAFIKLQKISLNKNSFSNRCLQSINKKRFNKLTLFSRTIFLKLIRKGQISGLKKSSW